MKDIQIRLLKADFPYIKTELFEGKKADKITKHFILEYSGLTLSLLNKKSFYYYLYPYLLMANKHSLNEIYTRIAQDYQCFDVNAYTMN